jgi:hypothetical protein
VRTADASRVMARVKALTVVHSSQFSGMANKQMARFRTHDLTKELAYVITQQSGQVGTFAFK